MIPPILPAIDPKIEARFPGRPLCACARARLASPGDVLIETTPHVVHTYAACTYPLRTVYR